MITGDDLRLGRDYVVAAVIATEVPPVPIGGFTAEMIPLAIRGVCDVIRNRTRDPRFPNTAVEVVLEPGQFSAVCAKDPKNLWRRAMAGTWFPPHVASCLAAWREVLVSVADGATHYYSPVEMHPPMSAPAWAAGMVEIPTPAIHPDYFRWFRS